MNRAHLSQLAVLATVAQCGSFRGAARELAIAPSAVSHAVSSLEARLGVRLLARSTRSVAPTEEGAQLLERLRPALSEIDLALETAIETRDRPAGNLRLTVPRTAAHLALTPRLGAFASAYPDIVLEIVIEDRFTDVVEGGFDAGVRLGESLQRDMIAVRIGPDLRGAVVGAPVYFEVNPKPRHPRDHLIAQAAVDGAGLAFVFEDYVRAPLADGRLIRVLEDWCPPFDGFFVYYPSRRQMRPALRAFVDFFKVSG
ncbi:MAG: LysR family transcriptional regulator [Mesorhizobium sp.]|nr:MAG: LysR family transcriptional regulator [Mesorhizobium sp.]